MSTTTMTIRLNAELKKTATETFEQMGLSLSNGVSIFLTQVVATKSIPFKVAVPTTEPQDPPHFGLSGEAYHQHLLRMKKEIMAGNIGTERELIEV